MFARRKSRRASTIRSCRATEDRLRAAGATHYLNAPGGRALYAAEDFRADGLTLEFLSPYDGTRTHMLHALCIESAPALAADASGWTVEPA
ncbi:MAG: WbqC family protein [Notoacmeibacter sp.]|nr:WbqC family protein [Notoacmeibacter sp.]